MNTTNNDSAHEIPSHSWGVADILTQSRSILYGPQDSHTGTTSDLDQKQMSGNMSNTNGNQNQLSPGDTGITSQQPLSTTNLGANIHTMPSWAADMCKTLQSIQGQLKDQLQIQNTRWQQIENQMTNQNTRMTRIESELTQMSEIQRKLTDTNKTIETINSEVDKLKDHKVEIDNSLQYYIESHDDLIRKNTDNDSKMETLARKIEQLEIQQQRADDKIVDVQWRSMRDNLVFTGINEPNLPRGEIENCETVIKNFLRYDMRIQKEIHFDRVHHLGFYNPQQKYPRPIVAKFTFYKDKELVRSEAPKTLIGSPFGVNEQFPKEIEEKRKVLYQEAKIARQNKQNKVRLVRDKLYINGQQYIPPERENNTRHNNTANYGRWRGRGRGKGRGSGQQFNSEYGHSYQTRFDQNNQSNRFVQGNSYEKQSNQQSFTTPTASSIHNINQGSTHELNQQDWPPLNQREPQWQPNDTYLSNLQQIPATQQLSSATPQMRLDINPQSASVPNSEAAARRKDNYYSGSQAEYRDGEIPKGNVLFSDSLLKQNQFYELSDRRQTNDANSASLAGKT